MVHPPSNTKRGFHLTHFIADRLAGPNMINRSSDIVKSKPHVTVKTMSSKERVKTLYKSIHVIPKLYELQTPLAEINKCTRQACGLKGS